jgi:hypothetical protein
MPPPADLSFQNFFERNLMPQLQAMENKRKNIANYVYAYYICLGISILCVWSVHINRDIASGWMALPIIASFILALVFLPMKKEYKNQFKQNIIAPLVKQLSPGFQYDPIMGIPEKEFMSTGMYDKNITEYTATDLVTGRIGETEFEFCEVEAKKPDGKSEETVFQGIFFVADFNKDFKGRTIIRPALSQNLGTVGKWLQELGQESKVVSLENVEFNSKFEVFSDDQVEARYIITPAFMEKLMHLDVELNANITVAFMRSQIYIGIPVYKSLFVPDIFKPFTDYTYIQGYYNYLVLVTGIVNELNLNTRLWTKE